MGEGQAQNSDEILEQKADSRVRVQQKPCDKFREMARERGANTKAWGTLQMKMWKKRNLPQSGLL